MASTACVSRIIARSFLRKNKRVIDAENKQEVLERNLDLWDLLGVGVGGTGLASLSTYALLYFTHSSHLPLSLSLPLSLFLAFYLPLSFFLYRYLYLSFSVCLLACLDDCMFIYKSVDLFLSLALAIYDSREHIHIHTRIYKPHIYIQITYVYTFTFVHLHTHSLSPTLS